MYTLKSNLRSRCKVWGVGWGGRAVPPEQRRTAEVACTQARSTGGCFQEVESSLYETKQEVMYCVYNVYIYTHVHIHIYIHTYVFVDLYQDYCDTIVIHDLSLFITNLQQHSR